MTKATEEGVPCDFVYCGVRRNAANGGMFIAIRRYGPGVPQGEAEMLFDHKRSRERIVGGIYRGALFTANGDGTTVRGLDNVHYVGKFTDRSSIIEWEAKHDESMRAHKSAKEEKHAARITEIEAIMAPLRKEYAAMLARHDIDTAICLERAVVRALKNSPYAREKE